MVEQFDYWIFGGVIAAPFVAMVFVSAFWWCRKARQQPYDYDVD